jgi:hypothetical protein
MSATASGDWDEMPLIVEEGLGRMHRTYPHHVPVQQHLHAHADPDSPVLGGRVRPQVLAQASRSCSSSACAARRPNSATMRSSRSGSTSIACNRGSRWRRLWSRSWSNCRPCGVNCGWLVPIVTWIM